MIDEIRRWYRANAHKLRDGPVFGKLRRSEVEDETLGIPPLYKGGFDVQNDATLAAFTVWGYGEMEIIIMDNKTAEEVVVDDRRIEKPEHMYAVLEHYCNQIITGGPFVKYQGSKGIQKSDD